MTAYMALDPRPAARQTMLELLSTPTFGVEVTVPELGLACLLGNADPQHTGGRADMSAIEGLAALFRGEAQVATVLPDLDSLGSMAVLDIAMDAIAQLGALAGEILWRIELIGRADRFERGEWPGRRPLPTLDQPWSDVLSGASDTRELAAMGAVVADHRLPVEERVRLLRIWLSTGEEPLEYRQRVEAERAEMLAALTGGEILVREAAKGHIATVVSTHRAGMAIGYHRAPVVVAQNPAFSFKGSAPVVKFTIAQFRVGYVDLSAALTELAGREPGWGGSPTIGGSPQGVSSGLSLDEVVAVVEAHLL